MINHHINSTINNAVASTSEDLDINMTQAKCSHEITADLAINFRNDESETEMTNSTQDFICLICNLAALDAMNVVYGFTMTMPGSQHQLLKL